jgi:hypothetical protein
MCSIYSGSASIGSLMYQFVALQLRQRFQDFVSALLPAFWGLQKAGIPLWTKTMVLKLRGGGRR